MFRIALVQEVSLIAFLAKAIYVIAASASCAINAVSALPHIHTLAIQTEKSTLAWACAGDTGEVLGIKVKVGAALRADICGRADFAIWSIANDAVFRVFYKIIIFFKCWFKLYFVIFKILLLYNFHFF